MSFVRGGVAGSRDVLEGVRLFDIWSWGRGLALY